MIDDLENRLGRETGDKPSENKKPGGSVVDGTEAELSKTN
jgi:hypothetical protein